MILFEFKTTRETNLAGFLEMLREKYPTLVARKRLCAHPEENTEELRRDCQKFKVAVVPISEFKETTFTAEEMAALKRVVDYAASCCGGGEDTIGAIMYTGGFRLLEGGADGGGVAKLARKIDCYGD